MLATRRLLLRRPIMDDLEDFHMVFSDPRTMRYWSRPAHTEIAETGDFLASMINEPATTGDDYVLEHQGRVIGKAGCWQIPEIGFILHHDFWGRGLMKEALSALIPYLFKSHNLPHLTADVDPRNTASIGLLSALGFAETHRASRTLKWGEEWCDSVYFSLPRETFENRISR